LTLCQLIKLVLNEQYGEIEPEGRDEAIKKQLTILGERYANLKSERYDGIDYSSPVSRFAYIQRYTVAHGDYIRQVIQGSSELRGVFDGKDVQVACLGGGPGSDFLGILKYMNRAGKKSPLTCYLFDKERAWSDSWSDVARLLERDFEFYPSFAQMDAADPSTYRSYHRIKKCDLLTLSYFMSEMWKYRRDVEPFFEHCFGCAKKGALVLYIDNRDADFRGWFDKLAAKYKLKILKEWSTELAFEIAEEKRDLGEYFDKFGWPKRQGSVDIRIAQKC
jgi:hypothetical protein